MAFAEKLVTSLQRGTANTRWRDYAHVYLLSRRHDLAADELRRALERVAEHRRVELISLRDVLEHHAPARTVALATVGCAVNVCRDGLPLDFAEVLSAVIESADPVLEGRAAASRWNAPARRWRR